MSDIVKTITVFRIIIGIGLFILFVFLSIGDKREISSKVVQERINEVIPFSFEQGNGEIIVKKAILIPLNNKLGFNIEFYYDDQNNLIRSFKEAFGFNKEVSGDIMSFIFTFDIKRDEGIIYFDNIDNVKVYWKETKEPVKVFQNRRFLKSFVTLMEDVKLYRIGKHDLIKNKILLEFLDFNKLGVNTKKEPFYIVVNYQLKTIYSIFLFFVLLITFSREIFLLVLYLYNLYFLNSEKYICAKKEKTGISCSQTTYEAVYNNGFIYGIIKYIEAINDCSDSYKYLKRNQKGKKMNPNIKVTSIFEALKNLKLSRIKNEKK